jgi:hypothetical protein
LGNSQLHPGKRCVSVLAGERDSSQEGSSVASTIQGQNSTPSSSRNNSVVADITPRATSTPSATQRQSIITPTATSGTISHNTPAPSGITQPDSTRCVESSPISGIAHTPTPLSGLENMPTTISTAEARGIIPSPLRTRVTGSNQRQRQWQLQLQTVSIPRSVVSGSSSIPRLGHPNMTRLVVVTGSVLELYLWNRCPCMSASELETVSWAKRRVAKALAEAPHW